MKTYKIKAAFGPTIQGEGSRAGTCVNFLRFSGCNRWTGLEKDREKSFCSFCDTDFRGGESRTATQVLEMLDRLYGPKVVVISGGEPTLQLDEEILSTLTKAGYSLHLETNGSNPLGALASFFDHITLSPKQPLAQTRLEACTDLKILYPLLHPEVNLENFKDFPAKNKFLQPVFDQHYEANLKATICRIYGNPEWRLSLQTHKMIGVT